MRLKALVIALVTALPLALLSVTSGPSVAVSGNGDTFVSVPYTRIATTFEVEPSAPKNVNVTGLGGIPTSGVAAVLIDVTATASNGATEVYAKTNTADTVAPFMYLKPQTGQVTNSTVVRVSPHGTIALAAGAYSFEADVDVQGYFTPATSGSQGGFVSIAPTRVFTSDRILDGPIYTIPNNLTANTTYELQVAGTNGIPNDATAVFANMRVKSNSGTGDGAIRVGPPSSSFATQPVYAIYGGSWGTSNKRPVTDMAGALKLGPDGKLAVRTSSAVHVEIDVQGYFSGSTEGAGFTAVAGASIYSSQTTTALAAGETREVPATGLAGIPALDAATSPSSLLVTAIARDWSVSTGAISVYNPDLGVPQYTTLSWGTAYASSAGPQQTTTAVGVSTEGTVAIKNNSAGVLHVQLTSQGWFSAIPVDLPIDDAPPAPAPNPGPLCTGSGCEPRMVAGVASSAVADVQAFAVPVESDSLSVIDSTADYLPLETATTTLNGSGFEVGLSPAEVPAGYVNSEGVVDVRVSVTKTDGGIEIGTASVQAVDDPTDASQTVWADPSEVEVASSAPLTASRTPGASAATIADQVQSAISPAAADGTVLLVSADTIDVTPLTTSRSVFPPPASGCTDSLKQTKDVSTVVGTAYPAEGATGNFDISRSTGANYGVATSANGSSGWAQTAAKWKKDTGWGATWSASKAQRSFRVGVQYKKYKTVCMFGGYKITSYEWRIVGETGGATEAADLDRPSFPNSNCTDMGANITFYRNNASGSSYTNSAGVKFLGIIGIDLSTERNYGSTSKLIYKTGSKLVSLCGSNRVPASASKIMIKKKA